MDSESGFFDKIDFGSTNLGQTDSFHDFRLIYESTRGFTRLFVAKKSGRLFVIKSLKSEYVDNSVAQMVLRKEYDTAFAIDSPYVARLYDYTDIEDFGKCIVMEYCPGESLADRLASGSPLSFDDTESIVCSLLNCLDDIHAHGVVHRDIKPANLIYSASTRSLKLIDFGLAHSEQHYVLPQAAGTSGYESPEAHRPDYKASSDDDFYSAAMTLSALSPLCPKESRRALAKIINTLTSRQTPGADTARKLLHARMYHNHKALAWSLAAICVAALSLWLLSDVKENGHDRRADESADPTLTLSESSRPDDSGNNAPTASTASTAPTAQVKYDHDQQPSAESPDEQATISNNESYPYPPVNGVSFDEARLSKNFRKTRFDNYVILRTDNYLTGCMLQQFSSDATPERTAAAIKAFNSLDSVWKSVSAEVNSHFDAPDLHRAKGLVTQRHLYWTRENYIPLSVELARAEWEANNPSR